MPAVVGFTSLTALERAAVEAIIPNAPEPSEGEELKAKETVEEYLTRLGAGQAAIDSYVESFTTKGTAEFTELGRAMFLAIATDPVKAAQLLPLIAQAKAILGVSEK